MSDMEQIGNTGPRTVLVDLDTGTVIGTRTMLVYVPHGVELETDAEAIDLAVKTGHNLFVDLDDE